MAKARSLVGLDVHAAKIVAAVLDAETGELQFFGMNGENVWTHHYTVTTNPCDNTFSGTGVETGQDQNGAKTNHETVTGSFNTDGTISLVNTGDDGVVWSLDHIKTDNKTTTLATLINPSIPSNLEFHATAPVIPITSSKWAKQRNIGRAGHRAGPSALCSLARAVSGGAAISTPCRRSMASCSRGRRSGS